MNKLAYLAFLLALASTPYLAGAYSASSVNSLFTSYNVPTQLVSTLQTVNLTYNGKEYLGLYNSTYPRFIINLTGNYTFVLNVTSIYNVIRNETIQSALSHTNFAALSAQMHAFQASSAELLNDCYARTGFAGGFSCNVTNYCAACQAVPACAQYFQNPTTNQGFSGSYGSGLGSFGTAVMRFGNQYVWLNRSFNQFYASASQANSTGLAQRVAGMNSAYTSISNLSKSMQNSTIFMYDGPLSPEQLGSICSSYYNATTAPWYCVAVGYCENLGYNYSKLAAVGSLLSSVNSQPLSDAQIMQLAANVGNNESVYVYPVISKQKLAQLDAMLNATVPGYGALVNATAELLSHISNATLKAELTTIQSNYHNVTSDYFHANLSRANATLTLQYAALSNDFTTLNSTYASVLAYAANNTAKLIELQLYGASDAKVSDMALTQLTLNSQLSSGLISNVTGIGLRLKAIASQLSDYSTSPITLTEMARSIDSPFIRAMGSLLGMSYSSATGAAPLFGSILSLIVGIALIACLFIYRSYLMRKHKLAMNQRTAQNWRRVFLIASVLVLLYIIITYSLLTGANSSAPFSAFQSAYKGSQSVIVAVNGTPTLAESDCASMIGTQAIAQDKDPIIASFSSGLCKVGNSTSTSDACLSKYAGSNIPVIVLTSSSQSGIGLYSLYGTVLNVMGNDTTMQACYVSLLTR